MIGRHLMCRNAMSFHINFSQALHLYHDLGDVPLAFSQALKLVVDAFNLTGSECFAIGRIHLIIFIVTTTSITIIIIIINNISIMITTSITITITITIMIITIIIITLSELLRLS